MAKVYASLASTTIDPTQYSVGQGQLYTRKVYDFLNMTNGNTLFYKSRVFKDANLIKNPLKRRYEEYDNARSLDGSPYIGERYNVYEKLGRQIVFLDDVGGLSGYTHNDGYEDMPLQQSTRTNIENMKKKSWDNSVLKEGVDLDYDIFGGDTLPFNRYFLDEEIGDIKLNGKSVERKIDTRRFGRTRFTSPSNDDSGKVIATTYLLYDETTPDSFDRYSGTGPHDNQPEGTVIELIDEYSAPRNTLLGKTNELFRQGKMGSLINRFHTKAQEPNEIETAVDSEYGLSRGRNLKKAGPTTFHNGYSNPYCRVWTSHHQYSKMTDRIRPFVNGNGFKSINDIQGNFGDGLRPFKGYKRLSDMSSLQDNGLPLIAPYKSNNEESGVSQDTLVKKCMFSIENLAWKDINVNAKVDNTGQPVLTKEQQGPLGGRIMWFPPYNLKFTENVVTHWEGNNFIGRGEQVYTYTNTERSGTLNFTILVDHPSIVDKWATTAESTKKKEDDLLRFFAGCGELETDDNTEIPIYGKSIEANEIEELFEEPVNLLKDESRLSVDPVPEILQNFEKRFYVFFPNNLSGEDFMNDPRTIEDYLFNGYNNTGGYETANGPLSGCLNTEKIVGAHRTYHYQVDDNTINQYLRGSENNNYDTTAYGLNDDFVKLVASGTDFQIKTLKDFFQLDGYPVENLMNFKGAEEELKALITQDIREKYDIDIVVNGFASAHGGYVSTADGKDDNKRLSTKRAKYIISLLKTYNITDPEHIRFGGNKTTPVKDSSVSSFDAKAGRSAEVIITFTVKNNVKPEVPIEEQDDINDYWNRDRDYVSPDITDPAIVVAEKKKKTDYRIKEVTEYQKVSEATTFDNEYLYFKKIGSTDSLIKKNIVDKVQFFDPAFHSITPEGFNARLTFLHQCTRQGPTYSVADNSFEGKDGNGKKVTNFAGNLSFGRPPVCVLRIGDFYNTKIIIDSLSIDYDNGGGIQWDLNPEGIGIQPMLANITIGFKFLGGSDISGPIERLQNAVSSNFFANTSVYDRKADYRSTPVTIDNQTSKAWNASFIVDDKNTTHTDFNPN